MSHIEGRKAPTYFGLQAKRNLGDTPARVAVKANRQSVRDVGAQGPKDTHCAVDSSAAEIH